MAKKLDSKEVVILEKPRMSNVYTQEALVNLLEKKLPIIKGWSNQDFQNSQKKIIMVPEAGNEDITDPRGANYKRILICGQIFWRGNRLTYE